ncbi:amidohydrolase family protein [Arthrobacter sp. GCM10027362]|uniref:amidohydrolase family protein n=1 Tax=Arthrobacter sp. GCM10027362 TaxID=3273379 RepID=UPI00362E5DE8
MSGSRSGRSRSSWTVPCSGPPRRSPRTTADTGTTPATCSIPPEAYKDRVDAAYRAGWPVALHAIGDAAIDLAVEIITSCQDRYGRNALPNRIEHFGIARPDQVAAVAAAGIAVTPQAAFIGPLGDQFAALVGPGREGWLYRGRSLVDAGVLPAGSSDLPVADNNVRRAMQSSVDRRTEGGLVLGGAEEGLTPEEALRSYTEWAAAATGTAAEKGTLRAGKLADFAVLSGSPLEAGDICALEVLATIVGGRFTYNRLGTAGSRTGHLTGAHA